MSFLLQVTGAVGWRKDNIKYKKNEIYLDIVEEVNLMMSSKGQVLRSDVNGKIVMKVFLSGMPDVKLGLNEKLDVSSSFTLSAMPHSKALQSCMIAETPACPWSVGEDIFASRLPHS